MALRYLRDPLLAVAILCLALIPVMASASLMSGDVWRSGNKSLSSDPGQVAPRSYSTMITLEEGDVIWIDYEPEKLSCLIQPSDDDGFGEYLDSEERYEIPEDGTYTVTFRTETTARLKYEIHKEGFDQGENMVYLFPVTIAGAAGLVFYWYQKREKSDLKSIEVRGDEEAFRWKGPWGTESKGVPEEISEKMNWSFMVVPIATIPPSLITFYFWEQIYSIFLIVGESPLAVCCGWVLLTPIVAFISGISVSSGDGMVGPESWGGFTGAMVGCGFATAAHLIVTSAGAPLLISGIYAVAGIFYLTLVICYQVSK